MRSSRILIASWIIGRSSVVMGFSESALETLLILAMRGNKSSAQPSKESISLCRVKLRGRSERGEVGGDNVGEDLTKER